MRRGNRGMQPVYSAVLPTGNTHPARLWTIRGSALNLCNEQPSEAGRRRRKKTGSIKGSGAVAVSPGFATLPCTGAFAQTLPPAAVTGCSRLRELRVTFYSPSVRDTQAAQIVRNRSLHQLPSEPLAFPAFQASEPPIAPAFGAFEPHLPETAPENSRASSAGHDPVTAGIHVGHLVGKGAADGADSEWLRFFDPRHDG